MKVLFCREKQMLCFWREGLLSVQVIKLRKVKFYIKNYGGGGGAESKRRTLIFSLKCLKIRISICFPMRSVAHLDQGYIADV